MDLSNKLSTLQQIGIFLIVIPEVINAIKGLREDLKNIKTTLTSIFLLIIIILLG